MEKVEFLTVQTTVKASLDKAWDCWTKPEHIVHWNFASPEWQCPSATNDLQEGGIFTSRMEAKDGSMGFDFSGTHNTIVMHKEIGSEMADGRLMHVTFEEKAGVVEIVETFEPESENSLELQQGGWQAILDNYKKYVEQN